MEVKRKKKCRAAAVLVSIALLIGNIAEKNFVVQVIGAEATEETELAEETEDLNETEFAEETEVSEETERQGETEFQEETERLVETEFLEETEELSKIEFPEETEQPGETELPEETKLLDETELFKEPEQLKETQVLDEPEQAEELKLPDQKRFPMSEISMEIVEETEIRIDSETEIESETETTCEIETEYTTEGSLWELQPQPCVYASGPYWDASWYVEMDFRFVQVEKDYRIVEGRGSIPVYEAPDMASEIVGKILYFGIVYVLKEENAQWLYIESGEVRGFIQKEYLADKNYADTIVSVIGEDAFQLAEISCEKADNAAYTYTHTTVQEVLIPKEYSMVIQSGYIQEYPKESARNIGKISSGALVYLLEEIEEGWFFVESGDCRGFIKNEMLLSGSTAEKLVMVLGEETIALAETYIQPEENRSCYFTLTSVKSAETGNGERIAEFASSFVGKLPYVWGGTSLSSGADCSGFVQSVYAAFGIKLPRLAEEQGVSGLEIKSVSEAQPGDVIYWATGPHVGIFIGDGQVVQCSGNSSNTAANPGMGVTISSINYCPVTSIRRFQIETQWYADNVTEKSIDLTAYSKEQMELIWAIVAQEDNGSYTGALAVISSAMNRADSSAWSYLGNNALSQLTAPGQYCYSIDNYWKVRLGGNVPEYVKQAVNDCLKKGIRNHSFTSFRSTKGNQTGAQAVQIGGNWFFGE